MQDCGWGWHMLLHRKTPFRSSEKCLSHANNLHHSDFQARKQCYPEGNFTEIYPTAVHHHIDSFAHTLHLFCSGSWGRRNWLTWKNINILGINITSSTLECFTSTYLNMDGTMLTSNLHQISSLLVDYHPVSLHPVYSPGRDTHQISKRTPCCLSPAFSELHQN